jgi:hypothetical protein
VLEGGISRALFELYLGATSIVPDAKAAAVQGARNLLDYDNVRRNTKPSS